jgi:hypothetical protein
VRRIVGAALSVLLVAAACGGGSESAAPERAAKPSTTTTTEAPPPVAPLTGLPDPSGVTQSRPVVSIKIDNVDDARPQTGVDAADVVWDEVVEGQATRLLAMFQSQSPESVGPVRSVRLTDPLIVWPVGGVFAYSGGAKYAVDGINQAPVKQVNEGAAGDAMFRDGSRSAPHNLYARPEQLFAFGGEPVPPPPLFEYAAEAVTAGVEVSSFHVGFSRGFDPTYTWDAAAGAWVRSVGGEPFTVVSGATVAPRNVIVMPVVYAGGVGRIGAEAQMVGEAPVKVFTNGRVIEGTWRRADKAQRIEFLDAAGAPILLTPGTTWVELPDTSYAIDVTPAAGLTPPAS